MSTSNGPVAILKLATVGGAAAIGVFLAWQLGNRVPVIEQTLAEIKGTAVSISDEHDEFKIITKERDQKEDMQSDVMIKLLRGSCLNDAETAEERLRCNP